MTPSELIRLVSACGKNNVDRIKWGDLEIIFRSGTKVETKKVELKPVAERVRDLKESDEQPVDSAFIYDEDLFDDFEQYENHMIAKAVE